MKKLGNLFWSVCVLYAAGAFAGEPRVENVVVVAPQRTSANATVAIDYEVVADEPGADVWVFPSAVDTSNNITVFPRTLKGDGANGPLKPGKYKLLWDVSADCPGVACSNLSVRVYAARGPYAVVDLSGGVDAKTFPVRYSITPPDVADDACRTSNLWLRLVVPGVFAMGTESNALDHGKSNPRHAVTLTHPYYLGVFSITQAQWELVMGSNPAYHKGAGRPVECVTYHMIRGAKNGSRWPQEKQVDADAFMGVLQSKTKLPFDLPTEAQWEYACRAGTTTALNNGKELTDATRCSNLNALGRYYHNRDDGRGGYKEHTTVGSYEPNAWGFYDMHGNVFEWCLGWHNPYMQDYSVTDPVGVYSGIGRNMRGGSWSSPRADYCSSSARTFHQPNYGNRYIGLRACVALK